MTGCIRHFCFTILNSNLKRKWLNCYPRSGYANGTSREKLTHCRCQRSGCIRNYCLCYDQKRVCGPSCRCNSEFNFRVIFFRPTMNMMISNSNSNFQIVRIDLNWIWITMDHQQVLVNHRPSADRHQVLCTQQQLQEWIARVCPKIPTRGLNGVSTARPKCAMTVKTMAIRQCVKS